MSEKIYIFDTTLRDGEQSAGVAFAPKHKLEIAKQLERLNVDIIEAGFPCSSPGDLHAVQRISKEVRGVSICALARCVKKDIDIAWDGIKEAADPRIHVFINTSALQIKHQLKKTPKEVALQAEEMVKYAARFTSNIEFSPMDATRTEPGFLYDIIKRCINAGATTINVPDSVGYALPSELGEFFKNILKNVDNIHKARISTHTHNDLGLSTANALASIQNGVRQVEVAVNGIGERAGNASLEEIVMTIKTRRDLLDMHTDINTPEIYRVSKLVENISGMKVQANKAIIGKNSFRHGSGIHQDGILKKRETWEIMDPADIGIPSGTEIVMGKLSGRHAFTNKITSMGYELNPEETEKAFITFKELADKKATIDDRDLDDIISNQLVKVDNPPWILENIQVVSGDNATATATLRIKNDKGEIVEDAAIGTGPVDAMYRAMNRITGIVPELTQFDIQSITEGIDAQGAVSIQIMEDNITYMGRASDVDIIVASAKAYTNALNRMIVSKRYKKPSNPPLTY